jgi:hypothetical protein
MKHLKQFESFSKVWESNEAKTTENVIKNYKENPKLWMMASNDYYNIITGEGDDQIKSLYPNWTLEDFKEVYLAMEGELPE